MRGYNHELFQQGRFNDTPILIGYTSDEAGDPPREITLARAKADLSKAPCKHTHEALIAAYPRLVSDEQTRTVVRQSNRDQNIGWSTWTWARLQTAGGDPNAPGLPRWDEFDETTQRVMVFDQLSRSREWPNLAALKAFTALLQCFAGLPAPPAD